MADESDRRFLRNVLQEPPQRQIPSPVPVAGPIPLSLLGMADESDRRFLRYVLQLGFEDYLNRRSVFEANLRGPLPLLEWTPWAEYADWELWRSYFSRVQGMHIFEEAIRKFPHNIGLYASYSRALIRDGNIEIARGVWDNAINQDLKNDMIWQQYAGFEEDAGYTKNARRVFERWLEHTEDRDMVWSKFADFEKRRSGVDDVRRVRTVFKRWSIANPSSLSCWRKYLEYEMEQPNTTPDIAFCLLKYALRRLPDELHEELQNSYWTMLQKRLSRLINFGDDHEEPGVEPVQEEHVEPVQEEHE